MSEPRPIADPRRTACLNDEHTLVATWAVGVDGSSWPWLADTSMDLDGEDWPGPYPAHEHLGPLPAWVQARLAATEELPT